MSSALYKRATAEDLPDTIQYREGFFMNARAQRIFYLTAFPLHKELRGIIFYMHGLGEHSGRYYNLYRHLCEWGFGVIACDLISHGRSDFEEDRIRAHTRSFHYFIDDVNGLLTMVKEEKLPNFVKDSNHMPPMIYMGLSYGTLVGVHMTLSGVHTFQAVVLLATAISVELTTILRVQAALSDILVKIIPKSHIVPAVNVDNLSKNKAFLDDIKKDPLVYIGPLTVRMGEQSYRAMQAIQNDPRIADPQSCIGQLSLLSLMGAEDRVTSVPIAKEFVDRAGCQDKEFKTFDGMTHCLLEDPGNEEVYAYLKNWLQTRFL